MLRSSRAKGAYRHASGIDTCIKGKHGNNSMACKLAQDLDDPHLLTPGEREGGCFMVYDESLQIVYLINIQYY